MSKEIREADPVVATPKTPQSFVGKVGVFLILLSGVFFFLMLSVPWLPIDGGSKMMLGGCLFIGVQVAWWVGAAFVGPTAIASIKAWLTRR